jgi:CO/xanthine dehydrogenase FAD-binding subunit
MGLGAYWRPRDLRAALEILAGEEAQPIAGGTDIMPARANAAAWEGAADGALLDLSALHELRGIAREGDGWRIGALATWADLRDAALPPGFGALQEASRQVGGRQVQARGTIVGNLCNASPAADGVPPLLVLDAEIEIAGPDGVRRVKLADFILGNRRTALGRGELLIAIRVPAGRAAVPSVFLKLGARSHLVISICMVAADAEGRIAVGACSEVARLLDGAALAPITDVRASAAYRHAAAAELVARARARLAA